MLSENIRRKPTLNFLFCSVYFRLVSCMRGYMLITFYATMQPWKKLRPEWFNHSRGGQCTKTPFTIDPITKVSEKSVLIKSCPIRGSVIRKWEIGRNNEVSDRTPETVWVRTYQFYQVIDISSQFCVTVLYTLAPCFFLLFFSLKVFINFCTIAHCNVPISFFHRPIFFNDA